MDDLRRNGRFIGLHQFKSAAKRERYPASARFADEIFPIEGRTGGSNDDDNVQGPTKGRNRVPSNPMHARVDDVVLWRERCHFVISQ